MARRGQRKRLPTHARRGQRKRMPTHNESCMSDRHDTDVRHVHAMEGDGGKWRGVEVQVVEEGWREVEGSNDSIG